MISITVEQREKTMAVIIEQIDRILRHCQKCLSSPQEPSYEFQGNEYEIFALFTHAVEELGKYVYFHTLSKNKSGNYNIENFIFERHDIKFELANTVMPKDTLTVYTGSYTESFSDDYSTDTQTSWDKRLNILNVDLDKDGNPNNIKFEVNIDELRKSVWDMRNEFPYKQTIDTYMQSDKHKLKIEKLIKQIP
jgi:hypothetical protein